MFVKSALQPFPQGLSGKSKRKTQDNVFLYILKKFLQSSLFKYFLSSMLYLEDRFIFTLFLCPVRRPLWSWIMLRWKMCTWKVQWKQMYKRAHLPKARP